ncbi:hypothetical protein [Gemella morbillorum]
MIKKNKVKSKKVQVIPYKQTFEEDGVIEIERGSYSKSLKVKSLECFNKGIFEKLLINMNLKSHYQLTIVDNDEVYITETIKSKNIKTAREEFNNSSIERALKRFCHVETANLLDRLNTFNYFYANGKQLEYTDKDLKKVSLNKKLIAPYEFINDKKYFKINEQYGQALYVKNLENLNKNGLLKEILEEQQPGYVSIHLKKLDIERLTNAIEINIKNDFETDIFIPYEFRTSLELIHQKVKEVIQNDEDMYLISVSILDTKNSIEDLNESVKEFNKTSNRYGVKIRNSFYKQKEGINSTLPYGINSLDLVSTLETNRIIGLAEMGEV